MKVNLRYPTFGEVLTGVPVTDHIVELTCFSQFIPLTPGDHVAVTRGGTVSGIVNLTPHWVVEVFLPLWAEEELVDAKVREWGLATDVEKTLGGTVLVKSLSRDWITDVIRGDPDVEFVELIRYPDQMLSFEEEVKRA